MLISIDNIYCRHEINNITESILKKCAHSTYAANKHLLLHIKDSIHYNALITNDYSTYNAMLEKHSQPEHSVNIFKDILNTFSLEKMDKIKVRYDDDIKKYIIEDGVHRLSIIVFKNLLQNNSISNKYLQIN